MDQNQIEHRISLYHGQKPGYLPPRVAEFTVARDPLNVKKQNHHRQWNKLLMISNVVSAFREAGRKRANQGLSKGRETAPIQIFDVHMGQVEQKLQPLREPEKQMIATKRSRTWLKCSECRRKKLKVGRTD